MGWPAIATDRIVGAPVDGKANAELISLIANHFKCRKSAVTISSGALARSKRVRVEPSL